MEKRKPLLGSRDVSVGWYFLSDTATDCDFCAVTFGSRLADFLDRC
jgi:hypothetical protein